MFENELATLEDVKGYALYLIWRLAECAGQEEPPITFNGGTAIITLEDMTITITNTR